jgi:hypothetical protein
VSEQPLHVILANTIKEVDALAQLHRESLAFTEAKDRLEFLHQLSRTLLNEIQSLSRWQAFSHSLHTVSSLQWYDSSLRDRELPEIPRSLGGAIVEGDMTYIRFIAQISGALALTHERKLTLVRQVSQYLIKALPAQETKQLDATLQGVVETITTLSLADSPDIQRLCQPILAHSRQLH